MIHFRTPLDQPIFNLTAGVRSSRGAVPGRDQAVPGAGPALPEPGADRERQDQGAGGEDLPGRREAGPEHHLRENKGDRALAFRKVGHFSWKLVSTNLSALVSLISS